jgi:two-component system sensor kinase FixL
VEDVTDLVALQHKEAERLGFEREQHRLVERLREANLQLARRASERAELQSELAHVSRLTELGQTISSLAHEVSQPLTAIDSYLAAAARLLEMGEAGEVREALQKSSAQVHRASQIVQRVREFARNSKFDRKAEQLPKVIEEACALALVGAQARELDLRVELDPDTADVMIDKIQVQQVLVNLLRNAAEAMADSPRKELAVVSARQPGGKVLLSVMDTGPGIAPEVHARLFQPFVTSKANGMGVGLSICRTIVEAHGGRLWSESNPGGGTVFRMTLPAVTEVPA